MINSVLNNFPCAYWPFLHLFGDVCSDALAMLKLDCRLDELQEFCILHIRPLLDGCGFFHFLDGVFHGAEVIRSSHRPPLCNAVFGLFDVLGKKFSFPELRFSLVFCVL